MLELAVATNAATAVARAGVYFDKPLERLSVSLRETQRLELLIVGTRERLAGCLAHPDKVEQAKCAERVWVDALEAVEGA